MSNHHLRNIALSLKAKGLACICKDGVDAICTTINELEHGGYLTRRRIRNERGQLTEIEYTIHEQSLTADNTPLSPKRENPVLDKPVLGKPEQAEPVLENPAQLNTKGLKTNPIISLKK